MHERMFPRKWSEPKKGKLWINKSSNSQDPSNSTPKKGLKDAPTIPPMHPSPKQPIIQYNTIYLLLFHRCVPFLPPEKSYYIIILWDLKHASSPHTRNNYWFFIGKAILKPNTNKNWFPLLGPI